MFNSSSEPRKTLPQLVTFPTLWPPWPPVIESASNTLPFCPIDSSDSISRPLKLTSWISHPRQSKPHRAHNSERHLLHSHLVSRKWRSVEIRNPKLLPQGGLQTTGRGFSFLYLPTVVNIVSPWRRADIAHPEDPSHPSLIPSTQIGWLLTAHNCSSKGPDPMAVHPAPPRHPPMSASPLQGLQACTTTHRLSTWFLGLKLGP